MPINRTPRRFLAFLKRVAWMQRSGIQGSFDHPDSVALHPGYSFICVCIGCLLAVLAGCSGPVIAEDEAPATPAVIQPSQKTLEDGTVLTRHAGDAWSRQKIREYLHNNTLVLDLRRSVGLVKDICPLVGDDLHSLNFEFIEPDLVVDDWEDPRLDPYKQKYERFQYGMGYLAGQPPEWAATPQWNITVYNLDTDGDGEIEAILYGERLKNSGMGSPSAGYLVFEGEVEWRRGGDVGYGDPSGIALDPDDYILSALIKVQNIYAMINVNDYDLKAFAEPEFNAQLHLIGIVNKHQRGSTKICHFELTPSTDAEGQ